MDVPDIIRKEHAGHVYAGVLILLLLTSLAVQAQTPTGGAAIQSLTVANAGPPSLKVTAPGGAIVVQASTDLVSWTDAAILFPQDGQTNFFDTEATNSDSRFYRLLDIQSAGETTITLADAADLRMISAIGGKLDVETRGYHVPGDGGGGMFYWDANATNADDGGITFAPQANPFQGRWVRISQGAINVKWFGAVGDGTNDDTLQIQAALDYVARKGGGKVLLPSGTYYVPSHPVFVGSGTTLEGYGDSSVILANSGYAGIADAGVSPAGIVSSNITIENLTVDCANIGNDGIVFNGTADSRIENVRVIKPRGYAIWLYRWGDSAGGEGHAPSHVVVTGCRVSGVVDEGIELYGAVGCSLIGNFVEGSHGAGFLVWYGSTDCTLAGNVAQGVTNNEGFLGYQVAGSIPGDTTPGKTPTHGITLTGNIARNVWKGVQVGTYAGLTNVPRRVLVEGNSLSAAGSGGIGIDIEACKDVSLVGNVISDFAAGLVMNNVSIGYAFNASTRIAIDRNIIKGGGSSLLYGNTGGSLAGNKFSGQNVTPVMLYGWQHCAVNDNLFVNPGLDQDAIGISVLAYNGVGCNGNTFMGNMCFDDRQMKHAAGTLVFQAGDQDKNIVTGNSAVGAKSGALAFINLGSGTNNVVANNLNN